MLRRLALLCLGLLVLIVTLSAYMRHDAAGLSCGDWSSCFGQAAAPVPASGSVLALARLGHRLAASLVLVVILVILLGSVLKRPVLPRVGALAGGLMTLAIGLAVLGALAAGSQLPAVVLGNLLGGFMMLALCVRLIVVTGRHAADRPGAGVRAAAVLAVAVLLVQLCLGGLVSASGAGSSCQSLQDCIALASASGWDTAAFDPWRVPSTASAGAAPVAGGAPVLLAHRVVGLASAFAIVLLAVFVLRRGQGRAALVLVLLLGVAAVAGLVLGAGRLTMPFALVHNLAAASLFAAVVRFL